MEYSLLCLAEFDYKWSRIDFQALFNPTELNELWSDLIEKGELVYRNNKKVDPNVKESAEIKCDDLQKENKSHSNAFHQNLFFSSIFNSWVWKRRPDQQHVEQCLDSMIDKQRELFNKSCTSILTLSRIKQQLLLADRCYQALQQDKARCKRLLLLKNGPSSERKFKEKNEGLSVKNPNQCLALVGSRAILHFAFAFLKRAWRSGEDGDLCSDLLEETLGIFQCLPAATFFNEADISGVWAEVIGKSKNFFKAVAKDDLVGGNSSHSCIPIKDRQTALSLYLELSLLQGSLASILDAVLFLLQLSASVSISQDTQKNRGIMHSPLVSILRRLSGSIAEVHGEDNVCPTTRNAGKNSIQNHLNVSKNFLKYMELPANDLTMISVKDAAIIAMCYLDSHASKYLWSTESSLVDSLGHQEIVSSGEIVHLDSYGLREIIFESIHDEIISQIACSKRSMLILSNGGLLYSLPFTTKCSEMQLISVEGKIFTSISSHQEAEHFLAVSSDGSVYSWGEGNFGQLGHGAENRCLMVPTQIKDLTGKFVVRTRCSSLYSAFVTNSGELYICGGTSLKLLSDDVTTPLLVNLPEKVIDVACETMESPFVVCCSGGLYSLVRTSVDMKTEIKHELCTNLAHIEASKIVSAPKSLFAIISKSGKLHLWNTSSESSKLVNNLSKNISEGEGLVSLNFSERVKDVSFTSSSIFVLLESGRVVSWGEDDSSRLKGDGFFMDGSTFQHHNHPPTKPGQRFVGLSCASNQSFAWTAGNNLKLPGHKEYLVDLSISTFEHLNQLLSLVFNSISGQSNWPPSQDEECLAVSSLNLLNLQLRCAKSSHLSDFFTRNMDLASSLKQKIISLASSEGVLSTIQEAAQVSLRSGWQILMPCHEERSKSLAALLQNNNGSSEYKSSSMGEKFMTSLLVESLMVEGELEGSVDLLFSSKQNENSKEIINLLAQQPNSKTKSDMINMTRSHESSKDAMNSILQQCPSLVGFQQGDCCMHTAVQQTPDDGQTELLDLVDLLFRNLVLETLERTKKKNPLAKNKFDCSFMRILLKFQRVFFASLLDIKAQDSINFYSDNEVLNASLLLKSYMNLVCHHLVELLKSIQNVQSTCELVSTRVTVEHSFIGSVLPEVMLSLLLVQMKNPSIAHFADLDDSLTSLLEELNNFTRTSSNAAKEEDGEMMWERFWAHDLKELKERLEMRHCTLRQSDLDNLLKEGMTWTKDGDKAYNMEKVCTLLGMSDESSKAYIGRNSSEIFEPGLHNKETLEKLPDCIIGIFNEELTSPLKSFGSQSSLVYSQRMLALLLGMQAKERAKSTLLSECEVNSFKWMKSSILTGGLVAMKDICSSEEDKETETSCLGPISYQGRVFHGTSKDIHLCAHFQLSKLGISRERGTRNEFGELVSFCTSTNPDFEVQKFHDIITCYCNSHSSFLPITFPPDHPLSDVTRFIIGVLLKHLNLWSDGQKILVENEANQRHVTLPDSITSICRVVCHIKKLLIKMHQDSGRSYKEVCSPILERCRFLLLEVGPVSNPFESLADDDFQPIRCRWVWATAKILESLGKRTCLEQTFNKKHLRTSLKEISKDQSLKTSIISDTSDQKFMKDSTNMDKEGQLHSFQHSLKHLDPCSQVIVRDIMEFLLHDETINLELLRQTLLNQNVRASVRLAGLQNITSLLHNNQLTDSSLFYVLLGWQGIFLSDAKSKFLSCLSNVHLVSPADKNNLEVAQGRFDSWVVNKLREVLKTVEAEVADYSADGGGRESPAERTRNLRRKQIDSLLETRRRKSLPVIANLCDDTAPKGEGMWNGEQPKKSLNHVKKHKRPESRFHDEEVADRLRKDKLGQSLPLSRFVPLLMSTLTTRHSPSSLNALIDSGILALVKTTFRMFVNESEVEDGGRRLVVEKDFQALVDEFLDDREAIYSSFDGTKMASLMKIGSRVIRGPNWNWGNQDGPQPGIGTLVSEIDEDGWVLVQWDYGSTHTYRMGKDNKYDLMLYEGPSFGTYLSKTKEEFHAYLYKRSLLSDSKETSNPVNSLFCNMASNLSNGICVNALLVRGGSLNVCAAAKLANHLRDIIDLTYIGAQNQTPFKGAGCLKFLFRGCFSDLDHWSAYGFVRSIASSSEISSKLVQCRWIEKLLNYFDDKNVQLMQKLQILMLLEAILPHFDGTTSPNDASLIINKLMLILGNLALQCRYDQSMKNNDLFACRGKKICDTFHLLSASHTSTIAEQLRSLLVGLFDSPSWVSVVKAFVSESLGALVLVSRQSSSFFDEKEFEGAFGEPPVEIVRLFGVLSFLGGVDETKLRLGGRVVHGEFGEGTVSGVDIAGDVLVQFDDFVCQKSCYYKELTVKQLSLDKVIKDVLSENMMNRWSDLLCFTFCFSSNFKKSEDPTKWGSESLGLCDSSKQREFIRNCQLKYFLLKASRILFSNQELYRKLLSTNNSTVDASSIASSHGNLSAGRVVPIFQHVLQLSTQPSPILPTYDVSDLEAALVSLFQTLNSGPSEETPTSAARHSNVFDDEDDRRHLPGSNFNKNSKSFRSSNSCRLSDGNSTAEEGAVGGGGRLSSEIVRQLTDMGFKRDKVQCALEQFGALCSGDESPPMIESVVTWLLENGSEEIDDPRNVETFKDLQSSSENVNENNQTLTSKNFLVREDFANPDLYAIYVRENIRVGMLVRCCRSYEDVKLDDVGVVRELDTDDLHDLNVRVDWTERGGAYWVGYVHLDLNGEKNAGSRSNNSERNIYLEVGDHVKIRDAIQEPFYGWGLANHTSLGIVTALSPNGEEVTVNFPQQSPWNGLTFELERVAPHQVPPHVASNTSRQIGLNNVERNCDLLSKYSEDRKLGPSALNASKNVGARNNFLKLKILKKPLERREMLIYDSKKCIKNIQASSREDVAQSLFESVGGFWQSSGSIGKHWIRLEMHENVLINQLSMTINLSDSSYIPSVLVIMGSLLPHQNHKEIATVHVSLNETEVLLLENVNQYYRFIEIQVRKCNNDGIDCRIPGLNVVGKLCFQENLQIFDHFSYLASDSNPSDCPDARTFTRETKLMMSKDIQHTYVFVWGLNDKDQLGGPRGSKIKVPILNEILSSLKCVQIAGGSKSLFCVTQDGKLYASGEATNGRLGLGLNSGHVSIPRQLISLSQYVIKKVAVHSGGRHALALTVDGKVFSWGEGDDGKLGHFNRLICDKPKLIEALRSKRVRDIACGSSHSAAIISNGDLYTWGLGEYGRLGHGDTLTQEQPKLVVALVGHRVVQVSLGSRDAQTLALTDEGLVFSWGDGDFGKLGRGGSEGCNIPLVIDKLTDLGVCQVECGAQFSLALTRLGQVWTWGKGDYFRLGHGTDAHVRKPQLVESLKDKKIVHVAVGALHCLAVTDTGKVYAWGDNDHGQQGNGTTVVNKKPALVHGLERYKINKVSCGSSHSLAWCTSDVPYSSTHEPVTFSPARDPLGTSLLESEVEDVDPSRADACETDAFKPPSLSRVVLSLETRSDKLRAMAHLMRGLHISYARNAIIEALKPVDYSVVLDEMHGPEVRSPPSDEEAMFPSGHKVFHSDDAKASDKSKTSGYDASLPAERFENRSAGDTGFGGECKLISKSCPEFGSNFIGGQHFSTKPSLPSLQFQHTTETAKDSTIEACNGSKNDVPTTSAADALATESQEVMNSGLDDFTRELSVDDSRMIVDLLKIAAAGRLQPSTQNILSSLLNSLAKSNPLVSEMLLELCVTELEDVSHNTLSVNNLLPVIQESPHPYTDNSDYSGTVRIPGASSLRVEFDRQCSTERRHDHLSIMDANMRVVSIRSGREVSNWSQELLVGGEELHWRFRSDGSVNGWGWRFTVYPATSRFSGQDHSSDRTLISRPSIHLVMCLLDLSLSHSNNHNVILRLAAALATCSQINSIAATQKIWILQKLRTLMISHFGKDINITLMMSASSHELSGCPSLVQLVKSLPETLLRQFEYEDPVVRSGKQLVFSRFFKVLVGLACDLGLDSYLSLSEPQNQRWSWFHKYCQATRVANSLQERNELPSSFCDDVVRKIKELGEEDESIARQHESHKLFTSAHDEQLLQWLNRKPDDWVLTSESSGQIWVWGHNHRGQLGGVEGAKIKVPVACEGLSVLRPVQIAGGEQTLFAVTADGKVYASGYGAGGRLGIGGTESVSVLTLLESIQHVLIKKLSVNSGGKHCLALTSDGDVFSWGEGEDGKLGHGTKTCCDRPRVIETLRGKDIVDVAAGGAHSACISARGELYTWGKGRYGRLGHGDGEDQLKPKLVEHIKDYRVIDVACGSGDAQTLCLTSDDSVWSWGDGDYGKLGRGGSEGCKVPIKIESLQGLGVIKVECGSQFSVALTRAGSIYTWGKGDYHRLGHGTDDHVRKPKRIMSLQGKKVIAVACGSLHCVCCTDSGEVYTWGDNDEGQLGDGSMIAIQKPRIVASLQGKKINKLACGSAHSFAWSSNKPNYSGKLPQEVPMEFNLLQNISPRIFRNRLILLHHFSDVLCPFITMIQLDSARGKSAGIHAYSDVLRGLLASSAKESVFKKVVQATMVRDKPHGPVIEINRIQVKRSRNRGGLAGVDGIKSVFGQICSKMEELSTDSLMLPHRVWKVKFIGESVDDCGGGYSESITEICDELQNGSVGILIQTPNGRDESGSNRDCFILNPSLNSGLHRNMFKFFGMLLGIAIRTGSPLNLNLAEPIWKQLVGQSLSITDLDEIDRDFVPGLMRLKDMDDDSLRISEMQFSTTNSAGTVINLSSRFQRIDSMNKDEYIAQALSCRMHEFEGAVKFVREGMSQVVPVPLLHLFTGLELETMVCGSPDIPVNLLKSVATYKGVEPNADLVHWFWEVMEEFTDVERSLFLRFVWGRTRLPRTIADFRGRDFVIQVLDRYDPPDSFLPESYTCFFLLKMPRYSSKKVLKEKLKYAIHFCKSIDTDDYARIALTSPHLDTESSNDDDGASCNTPSEGATSTDED